MAVAAENRAPAKVPEFSKEQDLEQQMASIKDELDALKSERAEWEQRVSLLRSDRIDPDMLEERGRALLDYVDPRDVTLLLKPR